jgi:oligoribonuclease NrnB/cAMP/cGMP phosphodiesterase (DHH superfamily)
MQENTIDESKEIVIIYHKNCHDGFAAAWAAFKKFGDSSSYLYASYGDSVPEGLQGKEVYIVDFSYDAVRLSQIAEVVKRLVVIDHHLGAKCHVTAQKEYVFELDHSGAYLAWQYFHPGVKVPDFIEYISEQDIWRQTLPDHDTLGIYIFSRKRTFEEFDKLYTLFEDVSKRREIIEKGKMLIEYRTLILEPALHSVNWVNLAGVIIPAVNVTLPLDERSTLLRDVYEIYPPIALSYRYDDGEWKCSLRSNGTFDCTILAGKFGGSGHPGSSGFAIKAEPRVFPFEIVEKPENTDARG